MISAALALVLLGPSAGPLLDRVALTPLAIEGSIAAEEAKAVEDGIADVLGRARYPIVPSAAVCADVECWRDAGRTADARYVVHARLRATTTDRTIDITVIDTVEGNVLSEASSTCDLCGRSELLDTVAAVTQRTRKRLDHFVEEPNVVEPSSSPSPVNVADPAAARDLAEQRRERAFVGSGAGLLVAGVAGIGVGAALVAMHATPIEGDCMQGNVDTDGDCRFVHDTRDGGIASITLGSAALVTGAVLLAVGLKSRRSRLRAAVSPRSVALELRF